jgi:alpha-L-fucosidase
MPTSRRRRANRPGSAPCEALERRTLLSATLAFNGAPQGVPGTVEFENYDAGGEGVSWHSPLANNPGGAFRQDKVGIQPTTDAGGGYNVGWATPGEWLNYTVNVASTTTYAIDLRVACGDQGGTFHLSVDGANLTGPIKLQNTGGWQSWTTLTAPNIAIPAGIHVLTLTIDSAAQTGWGIGNFNWMRLRDNPTTSPRLAWWRNAHYGMFVHWGLYSQLAGHWNGQTTPGLGEWIMNDLQIPPAQYAQVASQFNPTLFSAARWVQIAQKAGMQYIVLTAKHHDGFSMFNTSVNNFNSVAATPWHRDPVAELSAATHAAGLHFGVYYSIMNWSDPNASAAGVDTYVHTMETQLTELVTHDHPDILWFDGEWPSWWTDERGRELEEFVRNLNPSLIINNRVGKRLATDGDYDTPEQSIPPSAANGRLWETSMTLNDTWGYKDTDTDWKSPGTVIKNLADIVSKGGDFLLNVGPTGQGVIPGRSVIVLQQVGSWLVSNGQAIYGAGVAPVTTQPWGSLTRKGNSLYAIVFNWPANGILHIPIGGNVADATILNGSPLAFTSGSSGIDVAVPANMPNPAGTVIRLDFSSAMYAV